MFNQCESTDLLRLSDIQSGDALMDAQSFLFFSISPPFIPHNTQYNVFFSLAPVPFFLPFSPSPTATLPTVFPLRLIMDFVMFKDVFSGVY